VDDGFVSVAQSALLVVGVVPAVEVVEAGQGAEGGVDAKAQEGRRKRVCGGVPGKVGTSHVADH
jgi:hypothetical protein